MIVRKSPATSQPDWNPRVCTDSMTSGIATTPKHSFCHYTACMQITTNQVTSMHGFLHRMIGINLAASA